MLTEKKKRHTKIIQFFVWLRILKCFNKRPKVTIWESYKICYALLHNVKKWFVNKPSCSSTFCHMKNKYRYRLLVLTMIKESKSHVTLGRDYETKTKVSFVLQFSKFNATTNLRKSIRFLSIVFFEKLCFYIITKRYVKFK